MATDSPTIEEGQVSVQPCQSQYWKFNIEKRWKRGEIGRWGKLKFLRLNHSVISYPIKVLELSPKF